ncbi:hypothetical protein NBRC116594_10920 [Shimia sp. NS0008-38b]|uniref:hypothetical protein n=1 Tax=Shimia sp. NS0008-38b TaxID=3127653 RepID=UPI00310A60F4
MRVVLVFLALCLPVWSAALAQGSDVPTIDVQFEETETVPGQPLTLRLTVLVPTFMPDPPIWPDFESPNMLVRLPSKASTPTSKSIGGQTWAGISRRYQITPLVPGDFVLPESSVTVRYQSPQGDGVLETTLPVPEFRLNAVVPDGAEGLDPFVAAESLKLTQTVDGPTTELKAGDSFSRSVTAQIDGVTPMFLPSLLPEAALEGLRAYPETANVEETENRGVISGVRTETTVYVAEGAADGALPEITLSWYNLSTKEVEVASVPAVEVKASAPLAVSGGGDRGARAFARRAGIVVLGFAIVLFACWIFAKPIAGVIAARRLAWRESEAFAWKALKSALRAQDLSASQRAFDIWRRRCDRRAPDAEAAVEAAFLILGQAQFGLTAVADGSGAWRTLTQEVRGLRRKLRYRRATNPKALAVLNPDAAREG